MSSPTTLKEHNGKGEQRNQNQIAWHRDPEHVDHHQDHDQGRGYGSEPQAFPCLVEVAFLDGFIRFRVRLRPVFADACHFVSRLLNGDFDSFRIHRCHIKTNRHLVIGNVGGNVSDAGETLDGAGDQSGTMIAAHAGDSETGLTSGLRCCRCRAGHVVASFFNGASDLVVAGQVGVEFNLDTVIGDISGEVDDTRQPLNRSGDQTSAVVTPHARHYQLNGLAHRAVD